MMNCNPLISVVVPVYNVEKYLHKCVDSILAQTLKDIELILVDDGSPDNCGAICDEYAILDDRVKVVHQTNSGVSGARNAGITVAKGVWACFIDSDDTIDATYLEDFHIENAPCDLYLQGYRRIVDGSVTSVSSYIDYEGASFPDLMAYSEDARILNSPCYKLYKLEIIRNNKLLFDINTPYGEDHLFTLDYISHISTAFYSHAVGYNYFIAEGESLSHRLVPPESLIYYVTKSREKMLYLSNVYKSKVYLAAINRRLESDITKSIRELFKGNRSYDTFRKFKQIYSPLINWQSIKGISNLRKIYQLVFKFSPTLLLYKLLDKVL